MVKLAGDEIVKQEGEPLLRYARGTNIGNDQ